MMHPRKAGDMHWYWSALANDKSDDACPLDLKRTVLSNVLVMKVAA